jgi:signal transduction histidine kinase
MQQLRTSVGRPLPDALDALAHAFTAETGIRVHVRSSGHPSLPVTEEDELFRIASEALTNVRKHAHATDVELSLTARTGAVRLEIADNGRGFNPRGRSAGFGLIGMRERAQALGGRLRITSRPRRGTRLAVTIRGSSKFEVQSGK